jgi:hypothetical protein
MREISGDDSNIYNHVSANILALRALSKLLFLHSLTSLKLLLWESGLPRMGKMTKTYQTVLWVDSWWNCTDVEQ